MSRERVELHDEAWMEIDKQWLDPDEATALHTRLAEELPWFERPIVVFGREVLQKRLLSWAGDLPYRYSSQELEPLPWHPVLSALRDRLESELGVPFNHVLLNRYRDGHDHMSMHADNEPELGRCPTIASISLGARRPFVIERKKTRKKRHYPLTHGGLLVMGGTHQHTWRHAVPKQASLTTERLNLTFRWLRGPPGWRQPKDPVSTEPARAAT